MHHEFLIINDNHFIANNSGYEFKGSKFHLFTKGFKKSNIILSSPSLDYVERENLINIDKVNIKPRPGYGQAINFYKLLPFTLLKHYRTLKQHISEADTVLLVAPACTLPISYLICRLLHKPTALYLVGDVEEVVKQDNKSNSSLRLIKLLGNSWEWKVTKFIVKRHTTFTLGSALYNKLSPIAHDIRCAMTSLVSDTFIVQPTPYVFKDTIKLISISRLSPEKGIHLVLEALANIKLNHSIQYTIIGDGPEMNTLKNEVSRLGLDAEVIFTGYLNQQEIREYYLNADIFILPSLSEGIPKVILDAMATAVPVIATSVGGIPDLLPENQSRGWLIKPNSTKAIESAIVECISEEAIRDKRVFNAYNYIKQHTLEKEAAYIESILLELAR